MKKALAAMAAVILFGGAASGQVSLWTGASLPPAQKDALNLTREVKGQAFKAHDIVSIVVSLSAQASTDEQTDLKKSNADQLLIKQYLKLQPDGFGVNLKGEKPDNLGLNWTGSRKSQGDGQADREDFLRTRLAAEIVDIKPNGNLVIEARQVFTKQREKTTITLTGVVRPQDVGADNVVFSYNVADADIRYESSGPVTDANKRGWLSRALDKIWPF